MTESKMKMEVPVQVREFAKKSVDQAERAISTFIESASKSVALVPGPMTDMVRSSSEDFDQWAFVTGRHRRAPHGKPDMPNG